MSAVVFRFDITQVAGSHPSRFPFLTSSQTFVINHRFLEELNESKVFETKIELSWIFVFFPVKLCSLNLSSKNRCLSKKFWQLFSFLGFSKQSKKKYGTFLRMLISILKNRTFFCFWVSKFSLFCFFRNQNQTKKMNGKTILLEHFVLWWSHDQKSHNFCFTGYWNSILSKVK